MTADATATESYPMTGGQAHYEIGHTLRGAALFIDVRQSSQITNFVEEHYGPEAATALFMNFLVGVMSAVDSPNVYECGPSGDAVLAVFSGDTCVSDAIDAGGRAIRFMRTDFLRDNRHYLTCVGTCGKRDCRIPPTFQVGAGVDHGVVTPARIHVGKHDSTQLVGACISFASKLSGAAPPNTIAVGTSTFHVEPLLETRCVWKQREMTVGNFNRLVVLVDPPKEAGV